MASAGIYLSFTIVSTIVSGVINYFWLFPLCSLLLLFYFPERRLSAILKDIFYIYLYIVTILILLFALFYPPITEQLDQQASNEINAKISKIVSNSTNDAEKSISILYWTNQNLFNPYGCPALLSIAQLFGIYSSEPFVCIRSLGHKTPSLPFVSKCGACGEHSLLFRELANASGLKVRSIHNPGGDHNWAEVFVDGEWIVVETTRFDGYNFSKPSDFPTRKTYLFAEYPNLTREDVTVRYRGDLSNVSIITSEDGQLLENITILLLSHNLEGKALDTGLICFTDTNGTCNFMINKGNYTILAVRNTSYHAKKINVLIDQEYNRFSIRFDENWDGFFIYFLDAWALLNAGTQIFHLIEITIFVLLIIIMWGPIIFLFDPCYNYLKNK